MRHLFYIFVLFFLFFTCKAATIKFDDERFSYETTSNTTAKITKYNGSEKSVIFPTSVIYDGQEYKITEISGGYVIGSANPVEEIFIPSGITNLKQITKNSLSLKNAIIVDSPNNVISPFFFSDNASYNNTAFDNLIILSSCSLTTEDFFSNGASECFFRTGTISVYYQEKPNIPHYIQMYIFEKGGYDKRPFGETRFKYLLSALQKSGKDISTITKIDLSDLLSNNTNNQAVQFTFDTDNYNPSSELSSGAIVVTDTKRYTATGTRTITITDKVNFIAPQYSILTDITYNRSNTLKWNSVCLPFDIKESDFGGTCKIYKVTAATNSKISLTRVDTEGTVVEAGTPCFIHSTADNWNLNLHNVTISYNVAPKTIEVDGNWKVIGSFSNETIGTGKYKLNSEGSEFGITNSNEATVTAFRCYIAPTSTRTNAPAQLSVNIDEEASITLVPNDAEPQKVKLYDLMGRPRKEGSKGIFIKSTR